MQLSLARGQPQRAQEAYCPNQQACSIDSDVQRGEKAIVDLLGYNYLLEDQLKKRLTIFPDAEVGRGDVWKREIITQTPVPHVNKESFSLVEIKKKAVAGDYRWVARIKLNTKEVPLKDKGNRGTAKAFHPSLISSASPPVFPDRILVGICSAVFAYL